MNETSGQGTGVRIHPQALCESGRVGSNTRVGAFTHILAGAVIGQDCTIGDHVFVENDVVIGDRVTVRSGVQLWDGIRIANDATIGPNAAFPNDAGTPGPTSAAGRFTHVGVAASVGAGAIVLPGVRLGAQSVVSPGAVVTHDVPAKAIVSGDPARIVGYIDAPRRVLAQARREAPTGDVMVRGVRLAGLKFVEDLRGNLSVAQVGADLPFAPQRFFTVFDVPGPKVRGEHAHRVCEQFLVCVNGSVAIVVDDGRTSEEVLLDRPDLGLYVPPMVWAVQYQYSEGAVLLVLASHAYDPADYIRDYDEFLRLAGTDRP